MKRSEVTFRKHLHKYHTLDLLRIAFFVNIRNSAFDLKSCISKIDRIYTNTLLSVFSFEQTKLLKISLTDNYPERSVKTAPETVKGTSSHVSSVSSAAKNDFSPVNNAFEAFNKYSEAFNKYFEAFNKYSEAFNKYFEAFNNDSEAFNNDSEAFNNDFEAFNNHFEAFNNHFEAFNNHFEAFNNHFEAFNNHFEAFNNDFEAFNNDFEAFNNDFEEGKRKPESKKDTKSSGKIKKKKRGSKKSFNRKRIQIFNKAYREAYDYFQYSNEIIFSIENRHPAACLVILSPVNVKTIAFLLLIFLFRRKLNPDYPELVSRGKTFDGMIERYCGVPP